MGTTKYNLPSALLPDGWPAKFASSSVWDGADLVESDFVHVLEDDDVFEIEAALQHFKDLGLDGDEINCGNFPLPTLAPRLQNLALGLHQGKLFFVLRGLDPASYSYEDNIILYMGLSSYIGGKIGLQDTIGNVFAHIRDSKGTRVSQEDRPLRDSNLTSAFHTDTSCDILAMQTHSCAARGGNHVLASTAKVYNELAATRPDLVKVLASPVWLFDTRTDFTMPRKRSLLFYHGGKVMLNFVRTPLVGINNVPRVEGSEPLTQEQLEALDAVQRIAERHQLVLSMQTGDLTFVNNFGVLHAREGFEDDAVHRRHHVRMWLKNERLAWKLPRALQVSNDMIFKDQEIAKVWNIIDVPRVNFNIRERFTP